MLRIDTPEQWDELRCTIAPVVIRSRTHGEVLVPCATTVLVRRELVVANAYNPNHVSAEKMELLRRSIVDNGFCFPIVAIWDDEEKRFTIIDGFHRSVISGPDWLDFDYVPVAVLSHSLEQRMAATVQFNKARGVHQVDLDAELIRKLLEQGVSEEEIAGRLGMDLEAVHRYKQLTGVAALFANADYSMSWEMVDDA